MNWFKLYAEFAFDPKVQSLCESKQRRLVMIFCLTANGDLPGLTSEELCLALRISPRELEETKRVFIQKGFIDDAWSLRNWEKRQNPADPTAAERMRRYRNAHRNVARNGDVTVTGVTESVTRRVEKSREEERRGEENPPLPPSSSLGPEYTELGEYAIRLGSDVSWGTWVSRMGIAGHSASDIRAALDESAGAGKLAQPYVAKKLQGWAVEGRPKAASRNGAALKIKEYAPIDPEKLRPKIQAINPRWPASFKARVEASNKRIEEQQRREREAAS